MVLFKLTESTEDGINFYEINRGYFRRCPGSPKMIEVQGGNIKKIESKSGVNYVFWKIHIDNPVDTIEFLSLLREMHKKILLNTKFERLKPGIYERRNKNDYHNEFSGL